MSIFLCFIVSACNQTTSPEQLKNSMQVITVKPEKITSSLSYSGIVEPISTTAIISPVEGTIKEKNFKYGDILEAGNVIIVLHSDSLDKSYHSAVRDFLKAKATLANYQTNIIGTEALYKAGIYSEERYRNEASNLDDAKLAFIQAKYDLIEILNKTNVENKIIEQLKIGETEKVENALTQVISNISIKADKTGIALKPPTTSSDGSNADIKVGSQVKVGQLLISLGDMSGISLLLKVDEVNIRQVELNQKAIVTSPAFPGISLQGKVTGISSQADNSNSGIPTFDVIVKVDNLSAEQQKDIYVGMSANVSLAIEKDEAILIPIKAVSYIDERHFVEIKDSDTNDIVKVPIKVGATTLNKVQVVSGLKPGDQVVIRN